jgi:hypothetical protein
MAQYSRQATLLGISSCFVVLAKALGMLPAASLVSGAHSRMQPRICVDLLLCVPRGLTGVDACC